MIREVIFDFTLVDSSQLKAGWIVIVGWSISEYPPDYYLLRGEKLLNKLNNLDAEYAIPSNAHNDFLNLTPAIVEVNADRSN